MKRRRTAWTDIDEYIASYPPPVRKKLTDVRNIIRKNAPGATERISYQMPTFYLNGNLVHFAAYTNHIGFYPTPSGIQAFEKEFSDYSFSKGSVQFPLGQPLPTDLIAQVVRFRVEENLRRGAK
jgi:uncharacterized protein YdhG (YjbR/CyaY superfamily)